MVSEEDLKRTLGQPSVSLRLRPTTCTSASDLEMKDEPLFALVIAYVLSKAYRDRNSPISFGSR